MKKIIIASCYQFNVSRGVESYNENLARILSKDNDVEVFGLEGPFKFSSKDRLSYINIQGMPIKMYDFLYYLGNAPIIGRFLSILPQIHPWNLINKYFYYKLANYIRSEYPHDDIVLLVSGGGWKRKSFGDNVKVFHIGHAGGGRSDQFSLKEKPNLYVSINGVDVKNLSLEDVRFEVIYNTVSEHFLNKSTSYYNEGKYLERDIDILFVGALTEDKDPVSLIKILIEMDLYLKVAIIGSGPLKKLLKKISKNSKLTIIFDYVPHEKMFSYFQRSKIFILPSRHEPFGLVYREASINGCVVISPADDVRVKILPNAMFYEGNMSEVIMKALKSKGWGQAKSWSNEINIEKMRVKEFSNKWLRIID